MKKLFLKSLVILTLACTIPSFMSCVSKHEKMAGIQLYSVREDMKADPKGTIAQVGKMGYKYVETAGYNDGKFYGMEPAEFKKVVEDNGMIFLSSHTGQGLPDSAHWDSTMMWWDKCIAAHKAGGVKYIVQPWMGKEGYEGVEGLKKYCDYFNAVGEKCTAAGIRFGYHNHAKEFKDTNNFIIYNYMLENTDPAKVTFELDLYWIYKGGKNAVDYFEKYPGRFELYHVKDEKELSDSGEVDFKPAFEMAAKSGMKYYIVEVERYNFAPLESVRKSLEFIQKADFIKQ